MKKIDRVVLRETGFIALWTLIFSALMEAVFLVIGYFDYTVVLGNLLGAAAAVLNFFLMGLSVQKAVERDRQAGITAPSDSDEDFDEKDPTKKPAAIHKEAAQVVRLSQMLRTFMMVAFAVVGAIVPCFNIFAVLIPFFFPRIAVMLRPLFMRSAESSPQGGENS